MKVKRYEELVVWQKAMLLAKTVYVPSGYFRP